MSCRRTICSVQGSFFLPVSGAESVKEEYLELRLPLVEDKPFVQAIDLDLAARHSDYSIDSASSGISTNTFKIAGGLRTDRGYPFSQPAITAPRGAQSV